MNGSMMSDSEIVALFWNRNENAISMTSKKYGTYCMRVAMNILNNHSDSEECVNDTYLKAWNSIPPHKPAKLSTFLGKITRNLSFDIYRKKHTNTRGNGEMPVVLDELAEIISGGDIPEDIVIEKELIKEINQFLAGLSDEKRKIFVCRYWYADSVKDIAKKFKMTENNVSVTLARTRKMLRDYLVERGCMYE